MASLDASSALARLQAHQQNGSLVLSAAQQAQLDILVQQLDARSSTSRSPPQSCLPSVEYNVKVHSHLKLAKLFKHPPGAVVAYPETSDGTSGPVGHLIYVDPRDWHLPFQDMVYSYGAPDGGDSRERAIPQLTDSNGRPVRCIARHAACQGLKGCRAADMNVLTAAHTSASLVDVEDRLAERLEAAEAVKSPTRDVFSRTFAYVNAVLHVGCSAPPEGQFDAEQFGLVRFGDGERARTYRRPERCDAPIVFTEVPEGKPFLRCSLQDGKANNRHWVDYSIGNGQYDLEYLEAVFTGDKETAHRLEQAANREDHGPLAPCSTVLNFSNQRDVCPTLHRDKSGLVEHAIIHIPCRTKFRVYYPVPEDREHCPWVLLTSDGAHGHLPPLPETTPVAVETFLYSLLGRLHEDLADLTPRRFLRHPALQAELSLRLPHILNPTLCDLHPSLANRSHVGAYINRVKQDNFPEGTGWKGVLDLKRRQDVTLPEEQHYIRVAMELDDDDLSRHEEDDPATAGEASKRTRLVICMSRDGSRRLGKAAYIQSDIGHQRIVGFYEFELAAMDRVANTSVVFCRIYVTRQTAAVHQIIFHEISRIYRLDTGADLLWRHLHADSLDEVDGMILHWSADQHRGQAKGLGLHLVSLAAKLPADKPDLHQPDRLLRSLDAYEHLQRLFRLCVVHFFRNIKTSAVPEPVRVRMRSLACISHPDWDGAIEFIQRQGGKAGVDWVQDKVSSKFAFSGLCQERSFIPLDIWNAGEPNSNLVETVHRDVNREGVHCTLVGGLLRGQRFDRFKAVTVKEWEVHGIRPTYKPVTNAVNAEKNLKRQDRIRYKKIEQLDRKVYEHNQYMQHAHEEYGHALHDLRQFDRSTPLIELTVRASQGSIAGHRRTLQARVDHARARYEAQIEVGRTLHGLRLRGVLLPQNVCS
ncbi:hypothetical protein MKEN_00373200 [Mycena kentingensis (nom. inval.)]|nr:hypothetical protein MKEN_00373200 [Mycena kentingensis (nom. inval.)]